MSDLPESANVVVIGAGIVGNSVVGHLADLGWRDIVQIDKGPLPNPGGSTGHASNFIFPVDHNSEMALLTLDSQRQYNEMGVNTACGGVEIAREPQRLEEFRRRMTSAKAWGIDAWLRHAEGGRWSWCPFVDESHRPRRLLHAERLRRRLAAGRHPLPRAGPGARCAARLRRRRGAGRRDRTAAGCGPSSPTRVGSRRSTS